MTEDEWFASDDPSAMLEHLDTVETLVRGEGTRPEGPPSER